MQLPYDDTFFAGLEPGSARSASVVVPLVLRHFPAQSVVDVGCGVGAWLAEFSRHGVNECLGIDGDYVPRARLMIPQTSFHTCDLASFSPRGRRFDLACSLEVAEHLPPACAVPFVRSLVELAPVVLFSAAIPGQGGTGHLNEQWQSYWGGLFRDLGYVGVDCVRPAVFNDERVALWYRQNAIVYCLPDRVPSGLFPMTRAYEFDRVDLDLWRARQPTPKTRGLRRLFK